MLDSDLADLYGVQVKALNQAVKRNRKRFPADFIFRLTVQEAESLRSQIVTAKLRRGGRRTTPYVFTEQGVAMLSSVLRGSRAVRVNIEIMRAFVRLRRILASNADLARKLDALETKYDARFEIVFQAIRDLMAPVPALRKRIGFHQTDEAPKLSIRELHERVKRLDLPKTRGPETSSARRATTDEATVAA